MMDRSLIRRYVVAVHGLAQKAGQVDRVRDELERLQAAATADPRLPAILRHPEIALEEKRGMLLRLAGAEPSAIVAGLIDVLLSKERVEVLLGAADVFTDVADEAAGVARAHIEVAWEPDERQKQRLGDALAALIGMPVLTEFRTEPEILAGVRVRIQGRLIDGSIGGQLNRMLEQVRSAPMRLAGE